MDSGHQNESFLVKVTHIFTREAAKASLRHIFELFNNDKHHLVTEEMAKTIELKHTKVLSKADKSFLRMWAYSVGNSRVLGLLEASPDDLESYSWTEMVGKPMLELSSLESEHTPWMDEKKRTCGSQLHMQIRVAELSEELSVINGNLESVQQQNAEILQLLKRVPEQEGSEDPVFTRLRKDRESQPYHFRK
ncbi:hypothetical protein J3E69DRAFT_361950 [Trichoderma sp. SZMC 28015]